jgi:ribose transport system substrate-binding protein
MREKPAGGTWRGTRRARLIISASAVAALSLAVAACGSSNSSSASGSGTGTPAGGQNQAVSSKYPWCGSKQASIALADGFGDNTWRELTRYSAVTIAAECPSVTKYVYANGEGNTQKAISDINSLVAQGITGIVDFPDAGEAMLPVLTKAYQAGTIVVPYRVFPGGTAGQNYNAYISTDFTSAGVLWGKDVATALHGQGNVVFLGGQFTEPGRVPGAAVRLQELSRDPRHRPETLQRDQLGPGADAAGRGVAAVQVPEDRRGGQ